MELQLINDRADLDAISGTPEHAKFMALLAGSLWRLEKDDAAQAWMAVEDNTTVERFGFARSDFPDATPPELPAYEPAVPQVPQRVTRAQGKVVLIQMGLWQPVVDYVAAIADPMQKAVAEVALHDTQHWERNSPFLAQAAQALGMAGAQLDELFVRADGVVL
jgi:hypothetical protein